LSPSFNHNALNFYLQLASFRRVILSKSLVNVTFLNLPPHLDLSLLPSPQEPVNPPEETIYFSIHYQTPPHSRLLSQLSKP
jgi:hypothetical protein